MELDAIERDRAILRLASPLRHRGSPPVDVDFGRLLSVSHTRRGIQG